MQPMTNTSTLVRSLLLCLFFVLPSCITVNGQEYGISDLKNAFTSKSTKDREAYLKDHAGEPLAELARNDQSMVLGNENGLFFTDSVPLLTERDKLVAKNQSEQIGTPAWLETQAQIAAKSDRIVASERIGWERKRTEVNAAKSNAEAQMKSMSNPEPAQRAISMLDGQLGLISNKLEILAAFPAGCTDPAFHIPAELPKSTKKQDDNKEGEDKK